MKERAVRVCSQPFLFLEDANRTGLLAAVDDPDGIGSGKMYASGEVAFNGYGDVVEAKGIY